MTTEPRGPASAKMGVLRALAVIGVVCGCFGHSALSAPKKEGGSANCSCYCKSRTAEGVSVALPKTLRAPDGDLTKCEFLAGIACKNATPDDVSFGTLSLCRGLAESRRPVTRDPGKLPVNPLEQTQ